MPVQGEPAHTPGHSELFKVTPLRFGDHHNCFVGTTGYAVLPEAQSTVDTLWVVVSLPAVHFAQDDYLLGGQQPLLKVLHTVLAIFLPVAIKFCPETLQGFAPFL